MSGAANRIDRIFREAKEAIADMREEHERGARAQEQRSAALVDAECRARELNFSSRRARLARHLRPNECFGPRRVTADGPPEPVSRIDEKTRQQLITMGLKP